MNERPASLLFLRSEQVAEEGLRHRVRIAVAGNQDLRSRIRRVEYDLGQTFPDRRRRVDARGDLEFAIEVDAYGDFTVAAQVELAGQEDTGVEALTHVVHLPGASTRVEHAERDVWRPIGPGLVARRLTPWTVTSLELIVAALVFLMGYLVVVIWPDGTDAVTLAGSLRIVVGAEARLALLAGACGGLGALLQAATSLVAHPETYSLNRSWVRWYLLRPLPGIALGVVGYLVIRAGFLAPDAPPSAISPSGIATFAAMIGLFSRQATTRLQQITDALFAPLSAEPAFALEGDTMPAEGLNLSPDPLSGDATRRKAVAEAQAILRGMERPARETFDLAETLKDTNEFGLARRLFGRIRTAGDYTGLKPIKVGQRHALCTYKDPDLPAADRFKRALEILDEVDRLTNATTASMQETLGQRGAIHKRRWQVEGQPADLERSLGYYLKGYELGATAAGYNLETDQGYTGINAAFVLDLLAREDAAEVAKTGAPWMVADNRLQKAREIREMIATHLPMLPNTSTDAWIRGELSTKWWFHATVAEALFGLGRFEKAIEALRKYNEVNKLGHTGPPLESVSRWEFESTLTQLATLAQLHADLAGLLGSRPEFKRLFPLSPDEWRKGARVALEGYLGKLAPGVDRAMTGKVGLALSGGGFRASLFHIGVLAYLAERDVLRHVEALSCVSGGSIIGVQFYLEVQRLLEAKGDADITCEDYLDVVERLERSFLAGVQTNIRCQVFASAWANLRTFLQPGYTTTRRLGELYEAELYARVEDGRGDRPRYLPDLVVKPRGDGGFQPKYDNWRRRAKVPNLVINATTLNTGHNWQFTASWMGEPPSSIDQEIEGNYRLRRMYHWEAPRLADRWGSWFRRPFAPPDYRRFRLGDAVAASSCVPAIFEPLVLPDLFDGKTVRLVDGGVYDNQGVASLLEQDCNVMIVSDASGQMDTVDHPGGGRLGVYARSFSIAQARVRQAQYRELAARRRSGLLKSLMFMHLKKDLDADPLDWRECQDPHEASDEARPAERRGPLTRYGLQKSVQRLLSAIRTDLDSFTEVEAFALMTSGYRQAQTEFKQLKGFTDGETAARGWRFLRIEPALSPGAGFDDLKHQLEVAAQVAGKVWRLWPPLTVLGGGLLLAGLFGLYRLWAANRDVRLLTVGSLGALLLVLVGMMAVPHIMRLIRFRQTFKEIGLRGALAVSLAIGFKIHLLLFDPIFLRLGRLAAILKARGVPHA